MNTVKPHNKLFMAIGVLTSPLALCSGLSGVIMLVQKAHDVYFPAAYPIVGSGAIQDWIWPTLTMAFILGIFPVCFLFMFRNSQPYIIARIIQLLLFLVEGWLYMVMKPMPLRDLLFASQPFFMMGFAISLSIHGGMNPEPLLKR